MHTLASAWNSVGQRSSQYTRSAPAPVRPAVTSSHSAAASTAPSSASAGTMQPSHTAWKCLL